jgi:hypothetical protein
VSKCELLDLLRERYPESVGELSTLDDLAIQVWIEGEDASGQTQAATIRAAINGDILANPGNGVEWTTQRQYEDKAMVDLSARREAGDELRRRRAAAVRSTTDKRRSPRHRLTTTAATGRRAAPQGRPLSRL